MNALYWIVGVAFVVAVVLGVAHLMRSLDEMFRDDGGGW